MKLGQAENFAGDAGIDEDVGDLVGLIGQRERWCFGLLRETLAASVDQDGAFGEQTERGRQRGSDGSSSRTDAVWRSACAQATRPSGWPRPARAAA